MGHILKRFHDNWPPQTDREQTDHLVTLTLKLAVSWLGSNETTELLICTWDIVSQNE